MYLYLNIVQTYMHNRLLLPCNRMLKNTNFSKPLEIATKDFEFCIFQFEIVLFRLNAILHRLGIGFL